MIMMLDDSPPELFRERIKVGGWHWVALARHLGVWADFGFCCTEQSYWTSCGYASILLYIYSKPSGSPRLKLDSCCVLSNG